MYCRYPGFLIAVTCLFQKFSSSLFHFIHMRSPLKQYMRYLFHSCAKLTAYRLFFMFSKSFCLTICQFFYDVFPCQTFFYHQNHCMIQEIRDLIFDFFRIRILCCDHNFRCFFSNFFQDLINSLIKQIIRVRPLLWILFTVCDRVIYRFKDPKRIRLIIVNSYKRLEEAGRITGMACCSDLIYFASNVSRSQSIVRDFTYWK